MNQQSPIDITGYVEGDAPRLSFDYGERDVGAKRLSNTGDFVKVHYQNSGGIRLGDDSYHLVEAHFHNPSEHTIDGRRYALETHLVHARGAEIAVVGILYRTGEPNAAIEAVIESAPALGEPDAATSAFPASDFLPAGRGCYGYAGSLTTPPYTEGSAVAGDVRNPRSIGGTGGAAVGADGRGREQSGGSGVEWEGGVGVWDGVGGCLDTGQDPPNIQQMTQASLPVMVETLGRRKMLEQYTVSDILTWFEDEAIILNSDFQRRSVWSVSAKTYLIDTILRQRPMPNIMVRTVMDRRTRRSRREVVDGQHRMRAIREFADGKLVLGRHAGEYAGKRYADLCEYDQLNFLEYRIGVEQLFNADNEVVLDTFRRLNSYSYSLNAQEIRHAGYSGEFRSAVVAASRRWRILWEKYRIVGVRRQLRMDDDQLMAEMFGVIMLGVMDGGQPKINALYRDYDIELDKRVEAKVDKALKVIISELSPVLDTNISRPPHFLMLFAAVSHAIVGLPDGQIEDMPERSSKALSDPAMACDNLGALADCLNMSPDEVPSHLSEFRNASSGSTQRIAGRRIRFKTMYKSLMPERVW